MLTLFSTSRRTDGKRKGGIDEKVLKKEKKEREERHAYYVSA